MQLPEEIRCQLDACRSADELDRSEFQALAARLATDPELSAVFTKARDEDDQLSQAIHDVPVPVGLAERLLAAVGDPALCTMAPDSTIDSAHDQQVAAASRSSSSEKSTGWPGRKSRRWALGALASAALAAVWLAAVALPTKAPLTPANVFQLAAGWRDQLDASDRWQDSAGPEAYPLTPRVLSSVRGWTRFSNPYDRGAVAYDLSPAVADGPRITLFVLRTPASGFAKEPTSQPMYTQNRSIAAWRQGDLLYVVVVEGSRQQYHRYLETTRQPLA